MNRMFSWTRPLLLAGLVSGCATAQLSPGGASVVTGQSAPVGECRVLGTVIGEGGGTFGGAWISNAGLVEYAMNDARNQAAALGANYLQLGPPALGVGGSDGSTTTTTATVLGTAFYCEADPH